MGTVPVESFRDNGEHRSVTLGDLAALIAGIAVVLVLPTRQSYSPLSRKDSTGTVPMGFTSKSPAGLTALQESELSSKL